MHGKLSRRIIARTIAERLLDEPKRRAHWVKVLAAYLVEQRLTDEADLLVNDIALELFDRAGHLLVEVTTVRELSGRLRSELTRVLRTETGAAYIEFSERLDPHLLGGFIARTPSGQLDRSVRRNITQLAAIS